MGSSAPPLLRSSALCLLLLCASAPLLLCFPLPADQTTAEAAAKELAISAVRGPQAEFTAALDADALLEKKVGPEAWRGLTERQKTVLRTVLKERFAAMLAPPAPAPATGIAWSEAIASASGRDEVLVGIAVGEKTLKTRWVLKAAGGRRIEDVVLTDPGISLAAASLASLGALPAIRPPLFSRAGTRVVPWLALLAILAIFVAVTAPRVEPERRRILYLAAAVPAVIVVAGAIVAAVRLVSQPYVLHVEAVAPPPGPTDYERGLAARQRGDSGTAKASFEAALAGPRPAPGAARELAAMDLEAGRFSPAEQRIASYLSATGPDPDALALAAVIQANLGKQREAVESIAAARRLLGPGPKAAELEAKIRARASDAAGAVAALRPLVEKKTVSRETLRCDPSYLPIATAPEWVKFLNEKEAR